MAGVRSVASGLVKRSRLAPSRAGTEHLHSAVDQSSDTQGNNPLGTQAKPAPDALERRRQNCLVGSTRPTSRATTSPSASALLR